MGIEVACEVDLAAMEAQEVQEVQEVQAVALWGRLDSRGFCPLRTPAAPSLAVFAWLCASRIPGLRRSRERDLA